MSKEVKSIESPNEKPPILGKWSNIYLTLIVSQLILFVFFIYLTYKYNN